MFRLCEEDRAELFMNATKFNLDAVHTRTCLYNSKEKLFAADIYSHSQCMNKYLLQYKRDMQVEMENSPKIYGENIKKEFNTFVNTLELDKKGYTVSFCRDEINAKLDESKLSNKQVKRLLIEFYGEDICFTYPKDQSKPQMFFSSSIRQADIVETLRVKNSIVECAQKLRDECQNYSFNLDDSNCNARDIENSLNQYNLEKPPMWEMFFNSLFPQRSRYENLIRKCDTIFQIVFNLVHNCRRKVPLHVSISQGIHDKCRSKQLIQILNKLGLCISYDELERIDCSLANEIMSYCIESKVPLPQTITSSSIIHGAVDNFDHNENTFTGKGSSHDTILMVFQNSDNSKETDNSLHKSVNSNLERSRSFKFDLDCQKVLPFHKLARGKIPDNFKTGTLNIQGNVNESATMDFKLWILVRHKTPIPKDEIKIPSFVAMKSLISSENVRITNSAFTPIIPHPATDFSTIYTSMKNYQDILNQRNIPYGPLWCDEGVYRIAKEIQLLRPNEFGNIFLGMGGFHTEKIVLACLGKYLEKSGIEKVFEITETFGPDTVKSVLNGGHYIRSKKGGCTFVEFEKIQKFRVLFY